MRTLRVIAAVISVVIAGSAVADLSNRDAFKQSIRTVFVEPLVTGPTTKNIPTETTKRFGDCVTTALENLVDMRRIEATEGDTPQLGNVIREEVIAALAGSFISGNDPIAAFCPTEAAAFRSYL